MQFSAEQHEIWATLYQRQRERVQRYACREYLEGFEQLSLPSDHIPSLGSLNRRIHPATGWKTVRTAVRYTEAVPWYQAFSRQEFLVTDYMRGRHELDFTPEPDMFHDIFGHLPFMILPRYTQLQELFAPAFARASPEQREVIKRLAWYGTEFGLIRENGGVKVLGAGLISSSGEMEHVMAGRVPIVPFSVDNVEGHAKAIWNYNEVLFVVDSLEALRAELQGYFKTMGGSREGKPATELMPGPGG
jgi:phenylalanine-4-hydroxylase